MRAPWWQRWREWVCARVGHSHRWSHTWRYNGTWWTQCSRCGFIVDRDEPSKLRAFARSVRATLGGRPT